MTLNAAKSDKPNVPMPAPVFMVLCLLAAELVEWFVPVFSSPHILMTIVGWSLQLLAAILLLSCFWIFIKNKTTIMPANHVSTLVEKGPYRFSRNPMYLSLAMFHLGIVTSTANIWGYPAFALFVLLMRIYVINPEERYLNKRFAESYREYCDRVPRWI